MCLTWQVENRHQKWTKVPLPSFTFTCAVISNVPCVRSDNIYENIMPLSSFSFFRENRRAASKLRQIAFDVMCNMRCHHLLLRRQSVNPTATVYNSRSVISKLNENECNISRFILTRGSGLFRARERFQHRATRDKNFNANGELIPKCVVMWFHLNWKQKLSFVSQCIHNAHICTAIDNIEVATLRTELGVDLYAYGLRPFALHSTNTRKNVS